MKIKVAIANYGNSQLEHLNRVVEEFQRFKKHQVDLVVDTTVEVPYPHRMYPASVGAGLTFVCRDDMAASVDDYDLFIYNENDMLITEDNIDAFLEHSGELFDGFVSGFLRYENDPIKGKILTDLNVFWGKQMGRAVSEQDFVPHNVHQGCWVLLRKDLKKVIASKQFLNSPRKNLEDGASDPYSWCGLTKVMPRNVTACERLLIHHLPDKYIHRPEWKTGGITLQQLLESHTY